ncbi:MAG: hypothetical protein GY749_20760 [Desulfobacteraceae bacterium]|nr:hypothetical protein [Desulfobacteraceae bacterium]
MSGFVSIPFGTVFAYQDDCLNSKPVIPGKVGKPLHGFPGFNPESGGPETDMQESCRTVLDFLYERTNLDSGLKWENL